MKITFHNSSAASDPAFARLVRDECGVVLERCYQCLTCTLGCDAAGAMDLMPHEIVRLSHLGMRDRVLGCRSIWVCTSCEACVARCPNEIDIPHLMDTLHQIAAQEGFVSSEPAVPAFHAAFLMPIKMFGRQFEALMTGVFMLRKGSFSLSDMISNGRLGLKLFMRGKLKLKPHVIRGTGQMADIFRKTRKER